MSSKQHAHSLYVQLHMMMHPWASHNTTQEADIEREFLVMHDSYARRKVSQRALHVSRYSTAMTHLTVCEKGRTTHFGFKKHKKKAFMHNFDSAVGASSLCQQVLEQP